MNPQHQPKQQPRPAYHVTSAMNPRPPLQNGPLPPLLQQGEQAFLLMTIMKLTRWLVLLDRSCSETSFYPASQLGTCSPTARSRISTGSARPRIPAPTVSERHSSSVSTLTTRK
jgi:hypothetical protein